MKATEQWDLGRYATSIVGLLLVSKGFDREEVETYLEQNPVFAPGELVFEDPDRRPAGQRTKLNVEALHLLNSSTCCTTAERRALRKYSGWGGLSQNDLPAALGVVRPEELLASYYTPTRLTFDVSVALRPLLLRQRETLGRVLDCLEPSAGIGRFVQPWGPEIALGWQAWTAFERDPMSSHLLGKLFPKINVVPDIFESLRPWAPDFDLVLSNPPYGVRGAVQAQDPEGTAYATAQEYFVRKCVALLRPYGIGVFLVPSGLMSGTSAENRRLREDLFRSCRLMTACRLPNALFPGANLMVDLIIVRRREAEGLDPDDRSIVAGDWFAQHGDLILGQIGKGKFGADAILGKFDGLPRDLWKRPDLAVMRTGQPEVRGGATAIAAARSASRVLRERALAMRSAGIWDGLAELVEDVKAFEARLRQSGALEDRSVMADLSLVRDTSDVAEMAVARVKEQRQRPDDLAGIARDLIHERGFASAIDVAAVNARLGGRRTDPAEVEARLLGDGFGLSWTAQGVLLDTPEAFWSGDLYRHVDALEGNLDVRAIALRTRVLDRIKPVTFDEIAVPTARSPWLPLNVISAWIQHREGVGYPLPLVRTAAGLRSLHVKADSAVGWITGDGDLWGVVVAERQAADEEMQASWRGWWPTMSAELRDHVTNVYNRRMRGVLPPSAKPKALRLARLKIDLKPHQIEAVEKLGPRGLVALDVGLGKTFTGCALLARARQQGWARRPVVVVPPSLIGNWIAELRRAVPDMNYAIVGYDYTRSGKLKNDDANARRDKWLGLVSGEYDLLLASEPAALRLQFHDPPPTVLEHPLVASAVLEWASGRRKTERQTVVDDAMKAQWIAMMMRPIHDPDPITWKDVDPGLLLVDEAHHMRKAFPPAPVFGSVPDYAGNTQTSRTAFQLWCRCVQVPNVYLLTATPVVNGPVELLTLLTAVSPALFRRVNANTISEWMSMFLEVAVRPREKMSGSDFRTAITGLDNLETLRTLMEPVSVFMTAPATLGVKSPSNPGGLPAVESRTVLVAADLPTQTATDEIVRFIEKAIREEAFSQIGALLTALRKVAVHPQLYLQGELKAGRRELPEELTTPPEELLPTPKLRKLADNIRAMPTCGHLVFAESVAAHPWIKKFFESEGFTVKILNAEVAPTPDKRQAIAAAFNAGEVQVLVGNRVMMEGVNVQRHGCVVHHLDTPWSPSDLHQRNGRVVRQFSGFDQVMIFYYVIEGGADVLMLQAVAGKASWIQTIIGAGDATTNPAATAEVDPYLLLAKLSKNPSMWEKVYREKQEQKEAREREARARDNVKRARAYLKLMSTCGVDRERCRREAEKQLREIDPKIVRLERLRDAADRDGAWVTSFGDVWWPGAWAAVEAGEEVDAFQLGRFEHAQLGIRRRNSRLWARVGSNWLLENEKRSVRPISPPTEKLDDVPVDVVLNSDQTKALNWQEADRGWLREHWDPRVVMEALGRAPAMVSWRAPFEVNGTFQVLPLRSDAASSSTARLVPIYDVEAWMKSPAVLADAARQIASNYFGVTMGPEEGLMLRWVESQLFAYSGKAEDIERALGLVGATRIPTWVRSSSLMTLVTDTTRVVDSAAPASAGRGLRPNECCPIAGARLRGELLELLGSTKKKPLGHTAPGATLDYMLERVAFGATVAAWWPNLGQHFLRSGLAVRVLEEPESSKLAVALLRSPEPDLAARNQVLAVVYIDALEEAQQVGESLVAGLPRNLVPDLEEATADPFELGGALAALDVIGERSRPVFLTLDAGRLDVERAMGAWKVGVSVRSFRLKKPNELRRRFTVTMAAVASLVGDDSTRFWIGPATWSSATFTTGATASDLERTTRAMVAMPVAFRDLRGVLQTFSLELASQGLIVHANEMSVFIRHPVPFVPAGRAWAAGSDTRGVLGQFFGLIQVGLETAEGGDDEVRLVVDDGRFHAYRTATEVRPTIWPTLPDATITVPADKLAGGLKHLKKRPGTLAADRTSLRFIPADEQKGELKIDGTGTGVWSLGLRSPDVLRRALDDVTGEQPDVVTEEGELSAVNQVTLGVSDNRLWLSFNGVEMLV